MGEKIEYDPPRMAMIEHVKDDGSAAMVECKVKTNYGDGSYWMTYADPEDDSCEIMDFVMEYELQFCDKEGEAQE